MGDILQSSELKIGGKGPGGRILIFACSICIVLKLFSTLTVLEMARYKAEFFTVEFEFIYDTQIFYEQQIQTTHISINHSVVSMVSIVPTLFFLFP